MSSTSNPIQLVNGQQVVRVRGAEPGKNQIVLSYGVNPSAGTASIEFRLVGDDAWQKVPYATNFPATSDRVFNTYGSVAEYRITFAGLVGGSDAVLWVGAIEPEGFPPGAFEGTRALVVQPYTESNVKRGLQFYSRAVWPLSDVIPTGTARKLYFKTGAKPVIVKLRDFQYVAEEIRIQLFANPTGVTGGTPLVIHNFNTVSPVATSIVDARKNVTTATDGTEFDGGDPEYAFGWANSPNRNQAAIPTGRERIISPNSEFCVVITNTGSGDARAQYFLDWYEGDPDLPIP